VTFGFVKSGIIIVTTAVAAWGQTGPSVRLAEVTPSDPTVDFLTWQLFTMRDGLPSDRIGAIRVFDEQVWIGTDRGPALRQQDTWTTWTSDDRLPWPSISAIAVAKDTQDVWMGTWGGGLVRLTGGRFDVFDQMNSGLAGNFVFAVEVLNGRVWAATNAGLSVFDPVGDEWELLAQRRADSAQAAILSMAADDESLFVAMWGAGLRELVIDESRWRSVVRPSLDARESALAASTNSDALTGVCASGGFLWTVTPDAIWRRDRDGNWQARSLAADGQPMSFVNCVLAPGETEAWVGTDDGLRVLVDWPADRWVLFHGDRASSTGRIVMVEAGETRMVRAARGPIPAGSVTSLAFADGLAWVGTNEGLFRCVMKSADHLSTPTLSPKEKMASNAGSAKHNGLSAQIPQGHHGITAKSSDRILDDTARIDCTGVGIVRIGAAGSFTRTIRLPGQSRNRTAASFRIDVDAVRSALDHVNTTDRDKSPLPVELVMELGGFAKYGWGTPEDDFTLFAHDKPVLGIVGHLGSSDRILSAVLLRTRIPFVNTSFTPVASIEANNPCVFRCNANDPQIQQQVLELAMNSADDDRAAIIRTPQPDSRLHLNWWAGQVRARDFQTVLELNWDPASDCLQDIVDEVVRSRPSVVLTWSDASSSALILNGIREAGISPVFLGSDRIVCDEFIHDAGGGRERVFASFPCTHRFESPRRSLQESRPADSKSPGQFQFDDIEAALSWDATLHLCEAIDGAADRSVVSVQNALRQMREFPLAILENGQWRRQELNSTNVR